MKFGLAVYHEDERTGVFLLCPAEAAFLLAEEWGKRKKRRPGFELYPGHHATEGAWIIRHPDCSPEDLAFIMDCANIAGIPTHRIGLNVH